MALAINVGLNRKASEDCRSSGASIKIAAELDQTLLARPDELQDAVSELYERPEAAVGRRVNGGEAAEGGGGLTWTTIDIVGRLLRDAAPEVLRRVAAMCDGHGILEPR